MVISQLLEKISFCWKHIFWFEKNLYDKSIKIMLQNY